LILLGLQKDIFAKNGSKPKLAKVLQMGSKLQKETQIDCDHLQ
jgi:hypothetical protein